MLHIFTFASTLAHSTLQSPLKQSSMASGLLPSYSSFSSPIATCLQLSKLLYIRHQRPKCRADHSTTKLRTEVLPRHTHSSSFQNLYITPGACRASSMHRHYTLGVFASPPVVRNAHLLCGTQAATIHDHAAVHSPPNCTSALALPSYSTHQRRPPLIPYAVLTQMPIVLDRQQPASRLISAIVAKMRSPTKRYGHRKSTLQSTTAPFTKRRLTTSATSPKRLSHRHKKRKTVQRSSQMPNHHQHPPRTAITAP